jgi:hypothetical protein
VSPLAERFVYLNFIYLVVVFDRFDHPLELNLDRCIANYSDVLPLNIAASESFTRHDLPALLASHFVRDHMEEALSGVQTFIYSVVAPQELLTVTAVCFINGFLYGGLIDRWMRRICSSSD